MYLTTVCDCSLLMYVHVDWLLFSYPPVHLITGCIQCAAVMAENDPNYVSLISHMT